MEDDEDKPKVVLVPAKNRKIFINKMNSWKIKYLIDQIRTEHLDQNDIYVAKNYFMGTINKNKPPLPHLFRPEIVSLDSESHFKNKIFENDIFIFDLEESDMHEVDYIIKGIKTLNITEEKTLIIISSIMTWARTGPKYKKEKPEGEEGNMEGGEGNMEGGEGGEQVEPEPESEEEAVRLKTFI